jgi:surface antigen
MNRGIRTASQGRTRRLIASPLAACLAFGAGLLAATPAVAAPVALIPGPAVSDSAPYPARNGFVARRGMAETASDAVRDGAIDRSLGSTASAAALPYLQCVPYARKVSGIQLFGDAHTWWDQAAGRYERGFAPRPGAVMSFRAYGPMHLGHVAMVSKVVDQRTVLLRHANWSPINGVRGQTETDVRAIDVSDANDWSEVRVWYAPIQNLGSTHWPVDGFIYNRPSSRKSAIAAAPLRLASADTAHGTPATTRTMTSKARIDGDFLKGLAPEAAAPVRGNGAAPVRTYLASRRPASPAAATGSSSAALADDPIGRIIASHAR